MDLHSDHPFWSVKSGLVAVYPPLTGDLRCDVLIIGGGITGALVAHALTRAGVPCAVVDRRDIGQGSTSASTALLQYELDKPLHQLTQIHGCAAAERAYWLGVEAVRDLHKLAKGKCGFAARPSLLVSRRKRDVAMLRREFDARRQARLPVQWVDRAELHAIYGIDRDAAIRSSSTTAAECDPYLLTHHLLAGANAKGVPVFDRTEIRRFYPERRGVTLRTDRGGTIRARYVVFASGFETKEFVPQHIVKLVSTYAVVSEPLPPGPPWKDRALIWETGASYLYTRTCPDGRILFGGEDDAVLNPARRDRQLPRKARRLLTRFHHLMPGLDVEPAFSWAGTFGATQDGLAYIGPYKPFPHCLFALGFGGNGITFSATAARIIANLVRGKKDADAELFRFDR